MNSTSISRREILKGAATLGLLAVSHALQPMTLLASNRAGSSEPGVLTADLIDLTISEQNLRLNGREATAIMMNGSLPGPLIRLKEGQEATIRVTNRGPDDHGTGNQMVADYSRNRLHEPGAGLNAGEQRVLLYTDLKSLHPFDDHRRPDREVELHLTGHMERYMWSFDGKKYSETAPIHFRYGEMIRLTFVNDTMMEHPLHLHGMWMYLENGAGPYAPRKHTVLIKPAERLSVAVHADAPGRWAFHCHLQLHMEAGMFRVVEVSEPTTSS